MTTQGKETGNGAVAASADSGIDLAMLESASFRSIEIDRDPYTSGVQTSNQVGSAVRALHEYRTAAQQFMTGSDGILDQALTRDTRAVRGELFEPVRLMRNDYVSHMLAERGLQSSGPARTGQIATIERLKDSFVFAQAA
jgi:hypothetical protein